MRLKYMDAKATLYVAIYRVACFIARCSHGDVLNAADHFKHIHM